jgi:streptomycin 6-kinase
VTSALVPGSLPVVRELGRTAAARPWLAALPGLIEEVRDAYGLRLSAPLHGGSCSWVAPAELPDGTRAVLKIGWPHREMLAEPTALRRWDGRGAVRLLAHDPHRHALLLERCDPGTPLSAAPGPAEARLRTGCAVLRRLWSAPAPPPAAVTPTGAGAGTADGEAAIERLRDVTAEWAGLVEERLARLRTGYDRGLVAEGARLLRELPASAGRDVVLHGDANPGNLLAADGGRWLAIDPKPMTGDPAYDPWPLLAQVGDPFAGPAPLPVLRSRVALLADELALDPDRMIGWAIARAVEAALWTAEHDDVPGGAALLDAARLLAAV